MIKQNEDSYVWASFCIFHSKNYTYPVIARVRRGLVDTLLKGISVHIEPSGIEWDKTIGNSKIGASFGLHIRNILDLKLGKKMA